MTRHELMKQEVAKNPKRHRVKKAKKPAPAPAAPEPTPTPAPEKKPLPVVMPAPAPEPEFVPIIEKVEEEPIIEYVGEETTPIKLPLLEEIVKVDAKKLDHQAGKNVDVIATVPNVDHLINKVTDNEIDKLIKKIPQADDISN